VEYGQILEAARGELFQSGAERGLSYRLLRLALKHVWLHPARLRFAFALSRVFRDSGLPGLLRKSGIAKLISPRFHFALALLESSSGKRFNKTIAQATPGQRNQHAKDREVTEAPGTGLQVKTLLFTGCVGAGLFSRVNDATRRVLQANGFAVQAPSEQVCCGALHAHAGDLEGARTLARRNIAAFELDHANQNAPVITNAGGCGAMLASYAHLLEGDELFAQRAHKFSARVRDVGQQLATKAIEPGAAGIGGAVTYDASCHLLYGQHAGEASRQMLDTIPDLSFVRLEGSERCCGGAGIYNLLEPDLSGDVLDQKLSEIRKTGARFLATGNPGCQMQIGAGAILSGMDLIVCHPVELLDQSYARAGTSKAIDE
jgi:glycolate oxidase iron-sulfur subunit